MLILGFDRLPIHDPLRYLPHQSFRFARLGGDLLDHALADQVDKLTPEPHLCQLLLTLLIRVLVLFHLGY